VSEEGCSEGRIRWFGYTINREGRDRAKKGLGVRVKREISDKARVNKRNINDQTNSTKSFLFS
jgi:hypothetical protein